MDNGRGLGQLDTGNWGYYEQPLKNNLALQLMSSSMDQNRKPLQSNNTNVPLQYAGDTWCLNNINTNNDTLKFLYPFPQYPNCTFNFSSSHNLQMPQPSTVSIESEAEDEKEAPLRKRSQGPNHHKSPKLKKPKKDTSPLEKEAKKSEELVINGIDLDLSRLPTPICSCTGKPRQCYRWGVGGWQSACCTKNESTYPLPLSTKRRGARIAGRKMSLGAFKKVLEMLTGEGYNLSHPIDLKPFWAKHGTNKFKTIR